MHGNRYYDNVNYDDDDDDSYALDDNFFDYTTGIDGYDYNDEYYDDDGDDDDSSSSSDKDCAPYNTDVIFDMYGNVFTIDNDENVILYEDGDDDEKPMTTQAPQRQINAILAR